MKKNDIDFSTPQRESYLAIGLILGKTIKIIFRQILPILAVLVIGGGKNNSQYIVWTIIGIALLSMIYSLVNYFKTYYLVDDGELILHTGVFTKKKISIPLSKIQTVNTEQTVLHRLFDVVKLKIDTAGGEKEEFSLSAIELPNAQALRDLVLINKSKSEVAEKSDLAPAPASVQDQSLLMKLDIPALLKVGITRNHIKSGGLIFVFLFWAYQMLKDVGVDVDESYEDMSTDIFSFGNILLLFFAFIIISILISLGKTLINHYDLSFIRTKNGFKIISGLFTKKTVTALDHKIQYIAWDNNALERIVNANNIYLHQAVSEELAEKEKISIPGCSQSNVDQVVKTLIGDYNLSQLATNGIDFRYFSRRSTLIVMFVMLYSVIMIGFEQYYVITPVSIVAMILIVNRYRKFRKAAYTFNDEFVYVRGGVYGAKHEVMPTFKIQGISLHQSPYQSRHQLCNINIYTAAGNLGIPYIPYIDGKTMLDRCLMNVETSRKKWM